MLKIGFFGDGPWSHTSLDMLLKREDVEICFVVPRADVPDQYLLDMAKSNGIPTFEKVLVNKPESRQLFADSGAELYLSMSFNQIIKKELIEAPPKGFINCHAGALPNYRGRNILNWALINDAEDFGITVHYIDEGIDTGDIIVQENFPITDEDNYNTLLNRSYESCSDLLEKAVDKIIAGKVVRIKQETLGEGFYCGMRGPGDEYIEWNLESRRVFNFIRSITLPGIVARSFLKGQEVLFCESKMISGAKNYIGTPGQVVGKNDDGFVVKTLDSTILITKLMNSDREDITKKVRIGDRFVSYTDYKFQKIMESQ